MFVPSNLNTALKYKHTAFFKEEKQHRDFPDSILTGSGIPEMGGQ
jgi:hypothetical protein